MSVTLQDLRNQFYWILREEENTSSYPLVLVDQLLNSAQQRICAWEVKNPLTGDSVRKWVLPFLNSTQFYSNIPVVYLSADTTVWATELSVTSTSNFDSSWNIYIAGNIITYTGKTSTTFTGCTGVDFAFKSGVEVSALYTLPSDYYSPINLIYNNKVQLPAKLYDDIFEELNAYKWTQYRRSRANSAYWWAYTNDGFYSVLDWTYILVYNMNDSGAILKLRYEKAPTEMTASTDTATIDNDIYAKSTIPYLAVWEMLFNRNEEQRAWEILNFSIWQIKEMYAYYNKKTFENISWKQYWMNKWKINL